MSENVTQSENATQSDNAIHDFDDAPSSTSVHLLVLIHGMWGNPVHLAEMRRVIEERRGSEKGSHGEQLHLLVAETNRDDSTYDGIDWGGERVAEEQRHIAQLLARTLTGRGSLDVFEEIKKLESDGKKVTRFSVTGYSLGGLIARYLVGILHQRGFFTSVKPVNFNTVATPHVGLPRYPTVISSLFAFFGPKLLSRTGEQFYIVDKWSKNGRPLLEVMADPNRIFYQALTLFEHVRIYANAVNDVTVPYPTAAIEEEDIFVNHVEDGIQFELDEEYKPIVKSYTIPTSVVRPPKPRPLTADWFKSIKPNRPLLPPALQFSFPYNVLIYALTPVLIPLFLTLVITRLSLASKASRSRIKQLEKDESSTERLVHIIGSLEREMEDAVVDMFDNANNAPSADNGSSPRSASSEAVSADTGALSTDKDAVAKARKPEFVLSETQRRLVRWLNALPGLKKELAFIHPVRNAHGTIIARDVKRFPAHKLGEGVLRHLADHLIL